MKIQLLILSFFFPTFLIAQTQKKFFVEPIVNPLLVPIGSMGFEEYGLGYSKFNYEQSSTQEYALIFGRNFFNGKWNAGLGISHKKYRIDFDYMIRHPNSPDLVFRDATRYIDYKFYGLRLFTSYQFSDKFSARLTIEANEPYYIEKSHKSNFGLIQFFF